MKALSLFSGIGGLDLASEAAGIETAAMCEIDDFAAAILKRRFPDVPIYSDIRMLSSSRLNKDGVAGIDVIHGGFPCQDVSLSGKRTGFVSCDGKVTRSGLWREFSRLICEIRPRWVVAENVFGLLSISIDREPGGAFGSILRDLADMGYRIGWCCYGASDVGGVHERKRVAIVAYSVGKRRNSMEKSCKDKLPRIDLSSCQKKWNEQVDLPFDVHGIIANPKRGVLRNDDGLPEGMDRLKSLGNAVVPQQFYLVFRAIAEMDKLERSCVNA